MNLRWLTRLAGPEVWRLLAAALLGSAAQGCAIGLSGAAAWLIARAAQHPPVLYLTAAIVAVRAFGIGRGVLRYCERLVGHDAAFRVMARGQVRVYADLERAAPAGLGSLRSGDALARLVNDVEAVQDLLVRGLLPLAVAAFTGTASVVLLAAILPEAGLIMLIGLLVAGCVAPLLSLAASARADTRMAPERAALAVPVLEFLYGQSDLTAFGADARWRRRIHEQDRLLTSLFRRSARGSGIGAALATAALGATVVGELLAGIPAVQAGRLSVVWLPVIVLVPLTAFELTAVLSGAVQCLARGRPAIARLRELAELPHPAVATGIRQVPTGPLGFEIERIDVRWPQAAKPVLRNVDLAIEPGSRVAIVGASGSGKSTLVAALAGFLPAEAGTIRLGGVDLRELDDGSLRRAIAYCAQDSHLFDSSIRDNLRIGRPDASDAELLAVLRDVRLAGWVERQPDGLGTKVGERGVRLSGGERQRLVLARALLVDAPVLVLDEPTAHLDEPTAAAFVRDLLTAARDRTLVLVTHRLAELAHFDRIVELQPSACECGGEQDDAQRADQGEDRGAPGQPLTSRAARPSVQA